MLHEFLLVPRRNGGGVQSCSAMAQGGREANTFEVQVFFPYFNSFSLSPLTVPLSFFKRRERGRERTADGGKDIGVNKGDRQLQTQWHRWSSGWALLDVVRGFVNYVYPPPLLFAHHTHCDNNDT
jgi:hypothetical protein